jgi:uncharacterized membrane protein YeaQ/YmgE (transglycosylase-associated protein family)
MLASQWIKGGGYGIPADIVFTLIGGIIFSLLLPGSSVGVIGSIVVEFIGAVILIALLRLVGGRRGV